MTTTERLERLERDNTRLKQLASVTLAVFAVVILMGQGKAKKLEHVVAKSLTLKTDDGFVWFEAAAIGSGGLIRLSARDDKEFIVLRASNDAKELFMSNGVKSMRQVFLGVVPDDTSMLSLASKDGKSLAAVLEHPDGHGAFFALDRSEKLVWRGPSMSRFPPKELPLQRAARQCREYLKLTNVWRSAHNNTWPATLSEVSKELVDDPWGNAYVLVKKGDDVHVVSAGPDGQRGNDDDVSHPPRK